MAEFCIKCQSRANKTVLTKKDVILSKDLLLCEGCGRKKKVVMRYSNRYLVKRDVMRLFRGKRKAEKKERRLHNLGLDRLSAGVSKLLGGTRKVKAAAGAGVGLAEPGAVTLADRVNLLFAEHAAHRRPKKKAVKPEPAEPLAETEEIPAAELTFEAAEEAEQTAETTAPLPESAAAEVKEAAQKPQKKRKPAKDPTAKRADKAEKKEKPPGAAAKDSPAPKPKLSAQFKELLSKKKKDEKKVS